MSRITLLGPQADRPTVRGVFEELGYEGPVALITAGWQEWEPDIGGLQSQLDNPLVPLPLYALAERLWTLDSELLEAHQAMQHDLREIRRLYARQLDLAAEAWMELLAMDGPGRLLDPERRAALDAIHRLDEHHLGRISEVRSEFRERVRMDERDGVVQARSELLQRLEETDVVLVEGGHAAVLFNRITMFDLAEPIAKRTVVACAAGAMILCDRVLLYNDTPAIGRGNSEVGLRGLGLVPGLVVLPDATRRLRLGDVERMRRLALRVAPSQCVLLDPGARIDWDGTSLRGTASDVVGTDGRLNPVEDAA